MMMPSAGDPICPKCGASDSVRRMSVAAISPSPEDLALAERVRHPERPEYRSPWGFWSKLVVGLLVLGLAVVLIATEQNVPRLSAAGGPADPLFTYVLLSTLAFLLPIGVIVRRKERQRVDRRQDLSTEQEAWKRAMDHWERLYYCGRCDGVFALGERYLLATDEMEEFLVEVAADCQPSAASKPNLAA